MKKLISLLMVLIMSSVQLMAGERYSVNVNTLNVRESPSAKGRLAGTLTRGAIIDVLEIEGEFAAFDFMGKKCYASLKFLKKEGMADATGTTHKKAPASQPVSVTQASKSTATIYLFFDSKHYIKQFPIDINGVRACYMEGEESTSKMTGTRYEKSCREIKIHGEGKIVMSYDIVFGDKPYYNSITLDVNDGEVYYIRLGLENIINAITKKRGSWEFKILSPKEGEKKLKDNKFTKNPTVDFTL